MSHKTDFPTQAGHHKILGQMPSEGLDILICIHGHSFVRNAFQRSGAAECQCIIYSISNDSPYTVLRVVWTIVGLKQRHKYYLTLCNRFMYALIENH